MKISDFGLSRDIYAVDYYKVQSKSLLPVSPDSLVSEMTGFCLCNFVLVAGSVDASGKYYVWEVYDGV